ncbi:DUF7507 domain-containing protein [Mariniluteicoccus endophyticus]
MTLTKTADTTSLGAAGGPVTFTYTVKNNRPAGYYNRMYYASLDDDRCANVKVVSGLPTDARGNSYIEPGATATFRCTTTITTTTTNTATATFHDYWGTPVTTVSAQATVTVDAPWCGQVTFTTSSSATGAYGTFTPPGTAPSRTTLPDNNGYKNSAANAASPLQPGWIYYAAQLSVRGTENNGIYRINTTTGLTESVVTASPATATNRIAFDGKGTLWSFADNGHIYSLNNGVKTWVDHGVFTGSDGRSFTSMTMGDIAFDGLGNAWVMGVANRTSTLYTVSASELATTSGGRAQLVGRTAASAGFYGLAFGLDGTLYASRDDSQVTGAQTGTIFSINTTTGASTQVFSSPNLANVQDLGSCALPKPELRASKSVTPGPTVGTGTVLTYSISVENLGNLEATGVTLRDLIPAGATYMAGSTTLNGTTVPDVGGTMPYATAREIHSSGAHAGVVARGQKAVISFRVTVTGTSGQVCNQGNTAYVGSDVQTPGGIIVTDDPNQPGGGDATCVEIAKPELALDKKVVDPATGQEVDSKAAPFVTVAPGTEVTYKYYLTNPGNEPLQNVTLIDDKCPNPVLLAPANGQGDVDGDQILDLQETWLYSCKSVINQKTTNIATANGQGTISKQPTGPKTDDATVDVTSFKVRKAVTGDADGGTSPVVSVDPATNTFTLSYDIAVTNNSAIAANHPAMIDTMNVPAGVTVSSITLDGAAFPSGSIITIPASTTPLPAGGSKTYRVQIRGNISPVTVDWTKIGQCTTDAGGVTTGTGFVNTVTLPGDSDGSNNNTTCTPLSGVPGVGIIKYINDANPTAPTGKTTDGQDSDANALPGVTVVAGSPMTISFKVTNTGNQTLAPVVVTDNRVAAGSITCPAPATGNTIRSLAPGETVVCTATLTAPTGGFHTNLAHVEGTPPKNPDGSQPPNVTSENPANASVPGFAVEKSTTQPPLALAPGQTSVTRTYTIKVTNTGTVEATSPAVTDKPSVPAGFILRGATVGGATATVNPGGTFQVSPGVKLAPGASQEFTVVVTYDVDQAAVSSWNDLATCEAGTGASNPAKGLYNLVTMSGDSDGEDNNDACTPVYPPATVAKRAAADQPNPIVVGADGSFEVAYEIVVTNPSATTPARYNAITDRPGFAPGLNVTSVSVGGTVVTADANGVYPVAPEGTLAPGATKTFRVVVRGTTTLTVPEIATAGQCGTADGPGTPGKGLFNLVEMTGDPNTSDNDACINIAKPGFAVEKTTADGPVVLTPTQTELVRTYTVTVRNTTAVEGISQQVVDIPATPAGFRVVSVTVDGGAPQTAAPYVVTNGDLLAGNASKAHSVVVTYAIDQATIPADGWTNLGQCDASDDTPDTNKGLYNLVTMNDDSDGAANNDVCTPVTGTPQFAVKKETGQAPITLTPGQTTVSRDYTVVVTNTGQMKATSPAVSDKPSQPAGFTLTGATVGGVPVTINPDLTFQVTPGVELDRGASQTFTVVVTYTVDQAQVTDWTRLGECAAGVGASDPTKGLYNVVDMAGDSDGVDNNDACTPVSGPATVKKEVTPGTPNPVVVNPDGTFTVSYDIYVTNPSATLPADYNAIVDNPGFPAGFDITLVTVNGSVVTADAQGNYPVAPAGTLPAGGQAKFTVAITGTTALTPAEITAVGTCETAGPGTPGKGLFNAVEMAGDPDVNDNDACVPPVRPQFELQKLSDPAPIVLPIDATTVSHTYTITVKNTGTAAGTTAPITDTPSVPAGFTLTGATVDGAAATITNGSFPVSPGVLLEPNVTKTFTVVVTYAVNQAQVNWTTIGECQTAGATTDPAKGLYNLASMDRDSDGVDNNDTCNPVQPTTGFSVRKSTSQAPIKLTPTQATVTRDYTVTVKNTSNAPGTSKPVFDAPATPAGFTVSQVVVDGGAPQTAAPYVVTDGDLLAPQAEKVHTVSVTYAVDQAQITPEGWADLGMCEAGVGASNPAKGLYNLVNMDGDTDGVDNNDACTPVNGTPQFSVRKATSQAPVTLTPGQTEMTRDYTVTVKNSSNVAGTSPRVTDVPAAPAGFRVVSVTVGGTPQTAAPYVVTNGDQLAPQAEKVHTVSVTYAVEQAVITPEGWADLGTCEAGVGASNPAKGLYNVVDMDGDSDGADNNDACTPVKGTPTFAVRKATTQDPIVLASTQTSVTRDYTVTVKNTSNIAGTSQQVVDIPATPTGFTVTQVVVDGGAPQTAPEYVVTAGDQLAPQAEKVHTVTVTYAVDQAAITPTGWTDLSTCEAGVGASNPAKGLHNLVTLDGDTDGEDNNDACTPVKGTPTFAVKKTTAADPITLGVDDTTATRTYTVTVTNTGNVAGTSPAVVDAPSKPAGFTLTGATVDGAPVTLGADGTFQVTPGVALIKGQAKSFTVVVTYSVNQNQVDWAAIGECSTDGAATDPTKGLYNKVTMGDDTDGADNNDTCTPVKPTTAFSVRKATTQQPVGLTPGQATVSRDYTVTVKNTSHAPGTSAQVTDVPAAPAGFRIVSVTVDGGTPQTAAPYVVTTGDQLAAGAEKVHTVTVAYAVDQTQITPQGWTDLGTCEAGVGASNPAKGLYNVVTMGGDTDGEDNNDACTPVKGTPTFSVRKTTNQAPFVLDAGTTSVTRDYSVVVKNTSNVVGTSPKVVDIPAAPAGFRVVSVTVDGGRPQTAAPYVVTNGDALGAQASQTHTVRVVYAVDQSAITPQGWIDLATCEAGETASNPGKGLYNVVDMAGDTDGTENNDACTPLQGPSELKIVKYVNGNDANTAPGVAVEPGQPMQVTYLVTNTGRTTMSDVKVADQVLSPSGTVVSAITADATKWNVTTMATSAFSGTLEPGEAVLFRATIPAPAGGVQHTNEAVATGQPPTPPGGTPPPVVTTPPDPGNAWTPELRIVKKLNGLEAHTDGTAVAARPGDRVEVSLEVSNLGLGDMKDVTVTDRIVQGGTTPMTVTCPAPARSNVIPTLAAGQTVVCTASFVMPRGVHQDQASVTGTPEEPPTDVPGENPPPVTPPGVPPVVPPTVPPVTPPPSDGFAKTPAIEVIKFINGDDADTAPGVEVQPGSRMNITYKVTNTGAMPLTGVTLTDRVTAGGGQVEGLSCPKTELAVGESMECTATMPAPAAGGVQHSNTATVTGQPPTTPGGPVPPKVTDDNPGNAHTPPVVPGKPGVSIVKSINGDDANQAPGVQVQAGSQMRITYAVTNTGQTVLRDVTVTDDKVAASAITCPKTELAVAESMTCTATLAAPAADGQHVNTGTVVGTPPTNPDGSTPQPVTSTDKAHAHVPPAPKPWFPPLANTGGPAAGILAGGLAAMIGGGLLVRRRRDAED